MQKPLSLIIEDTRKQLIGVIRDSGLSPVLMKPIIQDIYEEVSRAYVQQVDTERDEYEKSLKEVTDGNNNNESKT